MNKFKLMCALALMYSLLIGFMIINSDDKCMAIEESTNNTVRNSDGEQ